MLTQLFLLCASLLFNRTSLLALRTSNIPWRWKLSSSTQSHQQAQLGRPQLQQKQRARISDNNLQGRRAAATLDFPARIKNQVILGKMKEPVVGERLAMATTVDNTPTASSNRNKGRLFLTGVAFLYGTLNVSLRYLYAMPNPPTAAALSFCRGWLTVACYLPTILLSMQQQSASTTDTSVPETFNSKKILPMWRVALEFAILNGASVGLLITGLLLTDSALRASFLTQTSVVITPLISCLAGQTVGINVWAGSFTALIGLLILATANMSTYATASGSAASLLSLSAGDLLVLSGAVCWSTFLFRSNTVGNHYPAVRLHALADTFRACLFTAWFAIEIWYRFTVNDSLTTLWQAASDLWPGWRSPVGWAILLFSAVGPGMLASVLIQKGQKELSASEANVILCTEPVFTALAALVLIGEVTTLKENIGGTLIFAAALLASGALDTVFTSHRKKQKSE